MGRSALGRRLLLVMLAVRQIGRAVLARLYASPLYRWRLRGTEPERLLIAPQDLRAADPTRATELVEGRFSFAGKTLDLASVSPFAINPPSPAWGEMLHGFAWLRHLRAADSAAGRRTARQLVGDYVRSGAHLRRAALDPAVAARRVLSWLAQAPLALDGADRGFHRAFLRSLVFQTNYLLRAGPIGRDGLTRLTAAIAAAQASLCLPDKLGLRRPATRWLMAELSRQVLPDGVHVGRNPQSALELLLDLLPLRQSFAARDLPAPAELLGAIDRMMPMLRFFRHGDGAFAAFNGMSYTQTHLVATLLAYDDSRGRPMQNAPHGGYQRAEAGGSVLIIDTGRPPPLAESGEAHAGALAFEFSADNTRLIVNCGAPPPGREGWRQLARATVAHSTAVVGEASSCRFVGSRLWRGLLGRLILTGPSTIAVERREDGTGVRLAASHDGYASAFGLIHRRELQLMPDGALFGRDYFLDRNGQPWAGKGAAMLRFHIHPAVNARLAEGEDLVLLDLPGGRSWVFQAQGGTMRLAESVHLANPEGPRRTMQILLGPPGQGEEARGIAWSLEPAPPPEEPDASS